ncbi:Wzz/FepE/Etk N-terminal domain-containing protein [uncultured Thiothrix sp.]|jgi:chain length determinant protein (polysaccharide antigen chain regulator)|uniref:Wzz/FepE/Etk N-terminal domain-containing protein n=1 Tax=uncultured Thiothrix sp. TaxID=223185 RepID=UPI0026274D90|nr:Wzz/FepE/Etk N-terminal domain-containing protein [uncultured Thiothrix sp.]HMT93831.1 Wzz/FepE/Etk N-terminal domain-containing protein [Thiolinea sp.]
MSLQSKNPNNFLINPSRKDEIELRDFIKKIIQYKKVVIFTFSFIFLIFLLYAFIGSPMYKAKALFLPPTIGDVAPLKIPTTTEQSSVTLDINQELVKSIYEHFEKNLNSLNLRREIFQKMNIIKLFKKSASTQADADLFFEQFNKNFTVEKITTKKDSSILAPINLTLKGSDPKLIADILNQTTNLVLSTTKQESIRDIIEQVNFKKAQLGREINELRAKADRKNIDEIIKLQEIDKIEREKLEDQIKTFRESAKIKRMDRIIELTEAAKIAESIGLTEKADLLENTILANNDRNAFYTEVNTQPQPLYLRGSKALRSEIKELTERTSDDPFVPGLRDLQDKVELLKTNRQVDALKARKSNDPFIETLRDKESELAILQAFKIDANQISVATLDRAAYPPEKRESPNRTKILLLGTIVGLILGILAALIANFWQSFRLEEGKV